MKKRKSRGLGSAPSAHVERAERELGYAQDALRAAVRAKTCTERGERAMSALTFASIARAELQGAGKNWAEAAGISSHARQLLRGCLR